MDQSGLDRSERKLRDVRGGMDGLVSAAKMVGAAMAAWGVASKASEAVETWRAFSAQMGVINTALGTTGARSEELGQQIQDMAVKMGRSLKDVGDATYTVLSTFGDSADVMGNVELAANMATAGAATTDEAFRLLSAVTKGYGDTSLEAQKKVADLAFTAVNLGQTTIPELAASMGRAIPLAATLGVTQEELFAIMTSLVGVTGDTAEVSTQMTSAMTALLTQTGEMETALKKVGITSVDAAIREFGLVGTLQKVMATTDGTTEAMTALFGRKEGLVMALSLIGASAQTQARSMDAMGKATGAVNTAARNAKGGLGSAAWEAAQLAAKVEVAQVQIGQKLTPAFESVKLQTLEFATALSDKLLPLFDILDEKTTATGDTTRELADNVAYVVKGLVIAYQTAMGLGQVLGIGVANTGAMAALLVQGDTAGAGRTAEQAKADIEAAMAGRGRKIRRVAESISDPAASAARLEGEARSREYGARRAAGGRSPHAGAGWQGELDRQYNVNGGGIQIQNQIINIPPGTSKEGAEDIIERALLKANDRQARKVADTLPER